MKIVLLGAPGCGKGTQSVRLSQKYGIPQISTGDMLRSAISEDSALGGKVRPYVNAGALVPDEIMLDYVETRLKSPDTVGGFILDGFPRSIPQADGLEDLLHSKGQELDRVVKVDVSKKVLLERMTSRRVCPGCAAVYNLLSRRPAVEGVCDRCGVHLIQREDDTEATVRRRLNVYESATAPLIDYYDGRHLLSILNGEGTADVVFDRITGLLERQAGLAGK